MHYSFNLGLCNMDPEGWKYIKSHTRHNYIVYCDTGPEVNVMFNMSCQDVKYTQRQCNTTNVCVYLWPISFNVT